MHRGEADRPDAGGGDPERARLERLVARALPADVARSIVRVEAGSHGVFASETAAVANARDGRRHEFFSGRRAARLALAALGLPAAPIPVGGSREPLWPPRVTGSITHSGGFCVAAATWSAARAAIGIDLEAARPLEAELTRLVATPRELLAASEAGLDDVHAHANLLFSIKEAFYKGAHARVRRFIDFQEVEVALGRADACSARLIDADGAPAEPDVRARGSCVRDGSFVFAFLELAPAKGPVPSAA